MRAVLGGVIAAAALAPAAHAGEWSANIAITSDYTFRGYTQSMGEPAVQGGFDYTAETWYAGVWASTIDFGIEGDLETDLYVGVTPKLGPVSFDLGLVGYFYPNSTNDYGDLDFFEAKAVATINPVEPLTLGAGLYYTPEFALNGGDGWYYEASGSYALTEAVALSGAVGHQSVDAPGYYFGIDDAYTTWNVGVTLSAGGFDLDLRYHDSDLDNDITDSRVVATLSHAL